MAQTRFSLPTGSRAYVGDKSYFSGQFMPAGLEFYTVTQTVVSSAAQVAGGAKSSYNAFIFVAAGATKTDIADALDDIGGAEDLDWNSFRSYYGQVGSSAGTTPIADEGETEGELFPFGFNATESPQEQPPTNDFWRHYEQDIREQGGNIGLIASSIKSYFGY